MTKDELRVLTQTAYHQVAVNGRGAARVYHAIVELDGKMLMWKKRAVDLGWVDEPPAER